MSVPKNSECYEYNIQPQFVVSYSKLTRLILRYFISIFSIACLNAELENYRKIIVFFFLFFWFWTIRSNYKYWSIQFTKKKKKVHRTQRKLRRNSVRNRFYRMQMIYHCFRQMHTMMMTTIHCKIFIRVIRSTPMAYFGGVLEYARTVDE